MKLACAQVSTNKDCRFVTSDGTEEVVRAQLKDHMNSAHREGVIAMEAEKNTTGADAIDASLKAQKPSDKPAA